jgi:hypothetical protein
MKVKIDNKKAKEIVDSIYYEISKANSFLDILGIAEKFDVDVKSLLKKDTYPQINFKLSSQDLRSIAPKILNSNYNIKTDLNLDNESVLTKLLYAIAWKNGDLKKIRHIVLGILGENPEYGTNDGIVLFYFGKYLMNPKLNSIIDQHVIRTFLLFRSIEPKEYGTIRMFKFVTKEHENLVQDYINWLNYNIKDSVKENPDFLFHIDKIFYALGKKIKLSSKSAIYPD